jgi:outer membrane protein TolC
MHYIKLRIIGVWFFVVGLVSGRLLAAIPAASTSTVLSLDETVHVALAVNSTVRAAEAQYHAAMHQIDQAYTPNDPQLSYAVGNSPSEQDSNGWTGTPSAYSGGHSFPASTALGLEHPAVKTVGISESFQFPGKSWLQGNQAHRNAEIARLTYMAAIRDTRAQAETVYYQTLLDKTAAQIAVENAASYGQVLEVARVAYTANQVTESDLISAQFSMSQASQTVWADQVAELNDEATLNQVMEREPQTPIQLTSAMALEPLTLSMDNIREKALAFRQELQEAALTEKNSKTALKLAWMELLPDFNVSYSRNWYYTAETAPHTGIARDNSGSIGINAPIFFWFHQKEDIQSAAATLQAARWNKDSIEIQTKTSVVQLYRSTDLAYQTALLYRNFLVPLAEKNLRVALIAYQSKGIDFTTLASILQNLYSARITYLTSMNQFLADKVGLEQLMGGPLK